MTLIFNAFNNNYNNNNVHMGKFQRSMGMADRERGWRRRHVSRSAGLHRRIHKLLPDHGENVRCVYDNIMYSYLYT